jgi:hypothetical protein
MARPEVEYFQVQAARCRRLARSASAEQSAILSAMAVKFVAEARALLRKR